jgi:large subunit ribosomal protein L3
MKFILGLKVGMSQMFDEKGDVVPVTVIEAGPCQVTQIKTKEKDGYETIQVGFKKIEKEKTIKKPMKKKPFRFLREFKIGQKIDEDKSSSEPFPQLRLGQVIDVSIFQAGDRVKVSGISKGKGFAGAVKRWGFHGRPATHGTKHELRTPGSVGTSFPERVTKGRKMPGRMGNARVTVKKLKVVKVDKENNLLAVKGAVPGRRGTLLEVVSAKQEV